MDGEDGRQLLGDIVVQGDAGPTRFIDLHNGAPCARPDVRQACMRGILMHFLRPSVC